MQVHAKEAAHNERVLAHQMALTEKLRALESRCEAMKQAETEMRQKNEVERQQFEKEKQQVALLTISYLDYSSLCCPLTMIFLLWQAQKLLEEASRQAELHAAMQCKQRDEQKLIIKKHEVIHILLAPCSKFSYKVVVELEATISVSQVVPLHIG